MALGTREWPELGYLKTTTVSIPFTFTKNFSFPQDSKKETYLHTQCGLNLPRRATAWLAALCFLPSITGFQNPKTICPSQHQRYSDTNENHSLSLPSNPFINSSHPILDFRVPPTRISPPPPDTPSSFTSSLPSFHPPSSLTPPTHSLPSSAGRGGGSGDGGRRDPPRPLHPTRWAVGGTTGSQHPSSPRPEAQIPFLDGLYFSWR